MGVCAFGGAASRGPLSCSAAIVGPPPPVRKMPSRRRSEVASAGMAFLKPIADGEFSYLLAYSKSNQDGTDRPENVKPVAGQAAQALREWL